MDPGEVTGQIADIASAIRIGQVPSGTKPLPSLDDLQRRDRQQDITLKRTYAIGLFIILGLQLAAADVLVYIYAGTGRHWNVPGNVINVWLGATVIQLIGVVLVVTRYLFPQRSPTATD